MNGNESFLGRGWAFPPTFSQGGADVEMASGVEDIHQSLQILLTTQPGERVLQENFGCDLQQFLFEKINHSLVNQITAIISDGILYHEPRIKLENLEVSERIEQPGLLFISLTYLVRGTNSRFNMVYPFYIDEAAVP